MLPTDRYYSSNMEGQPHSHATRAKKSTSVLQTVARFIPIGHEKPVKQALYTCGSIVLLAIVCWVSASAYFVLNVFVRPLLWALLSGSFLFPFKYMLNKYLDEFLEKNYDSDMPLFIEVSLYPFLLFSRLSDFLGYVLVRKLPTVLFTIIIFTIVYCLYHLELMSTMMVLALTFVRSLYEVFHQLALILEHPATLSATTLMLMLPAAIFRVRVLTFLCGMSAWFTAFSYIFGTWPWLQVPFTCFMLLLFVAGFFLSGTLLAPIADDSEHKMRKDYRLYESLKFLEKYRGASDIYFNLLLALLSVVILMKNISVILFLMIPLLFYFFKQLLFHERTRRLLDAMLLRLFGADLSACMSGIYEYVRNHISLIIPAPIAWMWGKIFDGDRVIHMFIWNRLPTITSATIILVIFTPTIIVLIFLTVQIQHESVNVLQLGTGVVNKTVHQHPELKAWFPNDEFMTSTVESLVDKAYTTGREWISEKLQDALSDQPNLKKIEKQTLLLWDKLYQEWFSKKTDSVQQLQQQQQQQQQHFSLFSSFTPGQQPGKADGQKQNLSSGVLEILYMKEVWEWFEGNVSKLVEFTESIWLLAKNNIALLGSIFTTVITTLLQGGTIVLNFIISLIVFFTTLFYLLSTSDRQYKPLEVLGDLTSPLASGHLVENAIEDAVRSVFGASIKMFTFYGMYTWVNHQLFGSDIVYIPAVLAAIFGVVPLLNSSWVCIPSVLELWLHKGNPVRATCLLVFQLAPTFFVDAAIYTEINRGAHPYLTALAVAGGLYTYGLEGAIFGPLIFCFLLVVANLYSSAVQELKGSSASLKAPAVYFDDDAEGSLELKPPILRAKEEQGEEVHLRRRRGPPKMTADARKVSFQVT